ncbi:MAG: YkgJ family cysteine cluster protein [Acidobacteria bacterium]|nr:YkgJ family cysteine cluster protein [Acidobacteriota bacterium]
MPADLALIQHLDTWLAESAQRSGPWLACRPGCAQCCLGPFAITALDVNRLREGLRQLPPEQAEQIRERARQAITALGPDYPGDPTTGELFDEDALPERLNDHPCPALDVETRHCELYQHRPVACRTFGPAVRIAQDHYGACELCYEGASPAELAACAVPLDPTGIEARLLEAHAGPGTIVAFALLR